MAKAEQPSLLGRGKPRGTAGKWCVPPARDLRCSPGSSAMPLSRRSRLGFSCGSCSRVCGVLAPPKKGMWPYLKRVRTGMPGPHEVPLHPVQRDEVLGASTGQEWDQPPAWGTKRHRCGAGGRKPQEGPKDPSA